MATEEQPQRKPYLLQRGEGGAQWALGGHYTLKADGAATDGLFSILDVVAFRSSEPPVHIHHREDEAWYVVDGQMTFHVAGEILVASAGSFVFAPRGLAHAFTVDVEPTRVLLLASPAGFERFAFEHARPATSETPPPDLSIPAPEILVPLAAEYGIDIVGPPLRATGVGG